MITITTKKIEYRGATFDITYSYLDGNLHLGGHITSPVSPDITIEWGKSEEGDTIDSYIDSFKHFIDVHHARTAIQKAFKE